MITTLLHPSFKSFQISVHLHARAVELVKKELLAQQQSSMSMNIMTVKPSLAVSFTNEPQFSKSNGCILSRCSDTPKMKLDTIPKPCEELEEYLSSEFQLTSNDDVLKFWLEKKSKFPHLFSLVQQTYAIPASNTCIERLFSASKNTVTDKRTSLGAEKVNRLLFLQKNLALLKRTDVGLVSNEPTVNTKRKAIESLVHRHTADDEQELVISNEKKTKSADENSFIDISMDMNESDGEID